MWWSIGDIAYNIHYEASFLILEFEDDARFGGKTMRTLCLTKGNGYHKVGNIDRWAGWPSDDTSNALWRKDA